MLNQLNQQISDLKNGQKTAAKGKGREKDKVKVKMVH
jgi:hypothetical protein